MRTAFFSVPTVKKLSERVSKGRDKGKTLTSLTSNNSSADNKRSKEVTTVVARAGAGTTSDRQSDSFNVKILSTVYLELSSKEERS